MAQMNYYKDRVVLNVLGGSVENARACYEAGEGHLSVGLGGGNPAQWRAVAEVAKHVHANHFNQAFCAVGWTRANLGDADCHVNAMVSPSGKPGYIKVSTGPISRDAAEPALVPVETGIMMVKEMGGNSLKFFPMGGLKVKDELRAVAEACAAQDFILEPTGGIDLGNFEEILRIILDAGVKKIIPHVYSSIIDKETGCTRTEDVKALLDIVKKLV